jgi:hypothetical protein
VGRCTLLAGFALAVAVAAPASAVTFPGPGHIYLCSNCTTYPYSTTATVIESFSAPPAVPGRNLGNISGTKTGPGYTELFSNQPSQPQRLAIMNSPASGAGHFNGMDGQYLSIGNGTSFYKLTFDSAVQFVSFAFNGLDSSAKVLLTFNDSSPGHLATVITLQGCAIVNLGSGCSVPTYGRVTYDFAGGVGLKAIQFIAGNGNGAVLRIDSIASAAPEPATWGMMILGFGLAGAQLRSRKRKAKLATA